MKLSKKFSVASLIAVSMAATVTMPAFAVVEPAPENYIVAESSFLNPDIKDNPKLYNDAGQLIDSKTSFTTSDFFHARKGEKLVFDVVKNDTIASDHKVDYSSLKISAEPTGEYEKVIALKSTGTFNIVDNKGTDIIKPVARYTEDENLLKDKSFVAWEPDVDYLDSIKMFYSIDVKNNKGEVVDTLKGDFIVGTANNVAEYCLLEGDVSSKDFPWKNVTHASEMSLKDKVINPSFSYCGINGHMDTATIKPGETITLDVTKNDIPEFNFLGGVKNSDGYSFKPNSIVMKDTISDKGEFSVSNGKVSFTANDAIEGEAVSYYDAIATKEVDGKIKEYKVIGMKAVVRVSPEAEKKSTTTAPLARFFSQTQTPVLAVAPLPTETSSKGDGSDTKSPTRETLVPVVPPVQSSPAPSEKEPAVTAKPGETPAPSVTTAPEKIEENNQKTPAIVKEGGASTPWELVFSLGFIISSGLYFIATKIMKISGRINR